MGPGTPANTTSQSTAPELSEGRVGKDLARLDVRDTTILKGLAITAIVLHNFFHRVSPARENEFSFHPGGFDVFLRTASHPALAVQAVFSFFGYLGVPIFIFLSAYGLAKKYWDDPSSWTRFIGDRIRKLFPMFGLVVLPWMFFDALQTGLPTFLRTVFPRIVLMFVGLSPLLPGMGLPPVGPWWFIPFIVEFYAIFYVLRAITKRFGWPGLLALSLLGMAGTLVVNPLLARWQINLYETPFGRMPSICLGIAAARYSFRLPLALVISVSTVILLGCVFPAWWPLTFPAVLIVALWAYLEVRPSLRESRTLERIGQYSLLIFLLNGIVRDHFVTLATTPALQLLFGAVTAVTSFAIAAMIQTLLIYPGPKESRSEPEKAAAD